MYLLCTVNRIANNGFKPFEMLFKASRCDDLDLLKSFTGEFSTVLKDMVRSDTYTYTVATFNFYHVNSHCILNNNHNPTGP